MTCHRWFVSQRLGFVLRCLDQGEERVFLRHVWTCPECVRGVRELERQIGWLAMAVEPVEVSPRLRQRARAQAMRRR
ncbi:MAG: hypothetical protein ACREMX_08485 [Gemmatimonadales bacterium]